MNAQPRRVEHLQTDKGNVPVYTTAVVEQPWSTYTREDHATWAALFERQQKILVGRAAREFIENQRQFGMTPQAIPMFDDLNRVLRKATGWNLIGVEGEGFKYILDGLNAERTLIAAECIGDGYWFIDRVTKYVGERIVFGRPIGQNQGVQFPIAESYIEVEAANLMRWQACNLFDARQPCGAQANMAKYLAAKASWEAANACIQFHGGFGFANEYDVERKFRETRLYQVAPISTNLIYSYVAEHLLGLPRSF